MGRRSLGNDGRKDRMSCRNDRMPHRKDGEAGRNHGKEGRNFSGDRRNHGKDRRNGAAGRRTFGKALIEARQAFTAPAASPSPRHERAPAALRADHDGAR